MKMSNYLKILTLFSVIVLSKANSLVKQTNDSDVFESVVYNLTLDLNLESSNFSGHLDLGFVNKKEISSIPLNKGDYYPYNIISGDIMDGPLQIKNWQDWFYIKVRNVFPNNTKHSFSIDFRGGKIRTDMVGLHKVPYKDENGKIKWLYLTNSYPTYARHVFPCFNSTLRATFNLRIQAPANFKVISNAPIKSKWENTTVFEQMSNLSAYNMAFAVGEFVSRKTYYSGKVVNIWTRPDVANSTNFALKNIPKLLMRLENLFGLKYPLAKLDLIAVPDDIPLNVGNLGFIIISESSLLYDEKISRSTDTVKIYRDLTQVLASLWLQNIITPSSWDQNWVGEGLAKLLASYLIPDKSDCYSCWKFYDDVFQEALLEKGINKTNVNRVASVLKMIFTAIDNQGGSNALQKTMQNFVASRRYQTAGIHDFYEAFKQINATSSEIKNGINVMTSYFEQDGYPLLNVSVYSENVTLTQETFFGKNNSIWTVPVFLEHPNTYMSRYYNLFNVKSRVITQIKGNQGLVTVSHTDAPGFYRVNYDTATWKKIITFLRSNMYNNITPIDRAFTLDDLFNLARAGYVDYDLVFQAMGYLIRENHFLPFKTVVKGLDHMINVVESKGTYNKVYKKFYEKLRSFINPLYENVIVDNNTDPFLCLDVIEFACRIGIQDCDKKMVTIFDQAIATNDIIKGDTRTAQYCAVLQKGINHYFEIALQYLKSSRYPSERLDILRSIRCYDSHRKLESFILSTLTGFEKSGIYESEVMELLQSIATHGVKRAEWFLNMMVRNYDKLKLYFKGEEKIVLLASKIGKTYQSDIILQLLGKLEKIGQSSQSKLKFQQVIAETTKEMNISQKIFEHIKDVLNKDDESVPDFRDQWNLEWFFYPPWSIVIISVVLLIVIICSVHAMYTRCYTRAGPYHTLRTHRKPQARTMF